MDPAPGASRTSAVHHRGNLLHGLHHSGHHRRADPPPRNRTAGRTNPTRNRTTVASANPGSRYRYGQRLHPHRAKKTPPRVAPLWGRHFRCRPHCRKTECGPQSNRNSVFPSRPVSSFRFHRSPVGPHSLQPSVHSESGDAHPRETSSRL